MDSIQEPPDFEILFKLVEEIYGLAYDIAIKEFTIKIKEAEIVMLTSTDSTYFINGKPPSQSFIEGSWKIVGLDGNLIGLRKELVGKKEKLDLLKNKLDLYKRMLDIWRTQSANERNVII